MKTSLALIMLIVTLGACSARIENELPQEAVAAAFAHLGESLGLSGRILGFDYDSASFEVREALQLDLATIEVENGAAQQWCAEISYYARDIATPDSILEKQSSVILVTQIDGKWQADSVRPISQIENLTSLWKRCSQYPEIVTKLNFDSGSKPPEEAFIVAENYLGGFLEDLSRFYPNLQHTSGLYDTVRYQRIGSRRSDVLAGEEQRWCLAIQFNLQNTLDGTTDNSVLVFTAIQIEGGWRAEPIETVLVSSINEPAFEDLWQRCLQQ